MRRRLSPFLSLPLIVLCGCDTEPFNVVAPAFSRNTGSALVSVRVPPFSRGLIQRVTIEVTAADTGRIRTIRRNMNFPIPGGNLSTDALIAALAQEYGGIVYSTDNDFNRFDGVTWRNPLG